MRRTRIGDVFVIHVPNGYKLFQWAYSIHRKGDYIRVFDGLFAQIPENVEEIISGPHSYIIAFAVSKAYRLGLAQFLGNYSIPVEYPYPKYQVHFHIDPVSRKMDAIHVMSSDGSNDVWQWFDAHSFEDLPEQYRDIKLLNCYLSPNLILYLFDVGFDLDHPSLFSPGPNSEDVLRKYSEIIDRL